ncbi:T6SS immunity protein Tli4 family protein [Burkholderia cenocepacia]|uniref:T6SS immunity protein Tli4 family protein n=1 Tax=Burkholderia cenocepacia TaxID=95486 RepID=UPI0024B832F8|nr:T6SS immunity protein Tli4 family protein [Burkholderia cenocepacia]MDI9695262.1 T6SS immunity protein Tli4 family protein [Burkholderia cenocepacia]
MKQGWKTCAIGRHLVDVPNEAETIESYKYNGVNLELMPSIKTQATFNNMVSQREKELRAAKHVTRGNMFVERVPHENGSVTLISWSDPDLDYEYYRFDTYFRAGSKSLMYSGEVSPDRKTAALATRQNLSREWHEVPDGELPEGIGFVAGDTILVDKDFNRESWELNIQLPNKPDVSFRLTAYAQKSVGSGLRARAGGILPALLGAVAGVGQLRNRARPVGPIEADEILVAGTQDGKRTYGFKWEAPGKAYSLAEPNLNASLRVGESAYLTNKESFANDGEALELWDGVVDSIRLRPGAV